MHLLDKGFITRYTRWYSTVGGGLYASHPQGPNPRLSNLWIDGVGLRAVIPSTGHDRSRIFTGNDKILLLYSRQKKRRIKMVQ